jgi:hypothetical protein
VELTIDEAKRPARGGAALDKRQALFMGMLERRPGRTQLGNQRAAQCGTTTVISGRVALRMRTHKVCKPRRRPWRLSYREGSGLSIVGVRVIPWEQRPIQQRGTLDGERVRGGNREWGSLLKSYVRRCVRAEGSYQDWLGVVR